MPLEPESPQEIKEAVSEIAAEKCNALEIKPETARKIDKFLQLAAQTGFIASTVDITTLPLAGAKVGGPALCAAGLMVLDLQATGGKNIRDLVHKAFGENASVEKALMICGLTACASLGGDAFYNMFKDGTLSNPLDSRWLVVATNLALIPLPIY